MNKILLDTKTKKFVDTGEPYRQNIGFLGRTHTEETKCRISQSLMGHPPTRGFKGRHHSEENKEKFRQSIGFLGRHHSEETKRKISQALKGHPPNRGFSGRHLSEESRKKLSQSLKGRVPTYGFAGHIHSDESKAKMSKARRLRAGTIGKGCKLCPICGDYTGEEANSKHHIKPVRDGGSDNSRNIVMLCRSCHDVVEMVYEEYDIPYSPRLRGMLRLKIAESRQPVSASAQESVK